MTSGADPTEVFISAAREYCEWAESGWNSPISAVERARELLLKLYLAALQLPDTEPEEIEIPQAENSPPSSVCQRLNSFPVGYYWECFNPLVTTAETPVGISVSDDLSDIYRDLKYGFACLEAGHKNEAVWQWKFTFQSHWGRHVLGALKAIHCHTEQNLFKE